jgi:hypothetical protein
LMVYGKYGRLHVSVTQDLTRLLVPADMPVADKVALTRELLQCLPPTNLFMRGRNPIELIRLDDAPNLADIFLHPCDQPFSVSALQDMIEQSGLHLATFTSFSGIPALTRLQYDPRWFAKSPALLARIESASLREQRQMAEIIDGNLWLHTVYVTRDRDPIATFFDPANIPFVPTSHAEFALSLLHRRPNEGIELRLANNTHLSLKLSPPTQRFLAAMDGTRGMQQILDVASIEANEVEPLRTDLHLLNGLDWVLARSPAVDAFPLIGDPLVFDESRLGDRPWVLPYEHPTMQTRPL